MTLQRQLAWRYALVAAACLGIAGELAYHQLVTEPRLREPLSLGQPRQNGPTENTELVFYGFIPLVLVCGWELVRRTLHPLKALTAALDQAHGQDPRTPLPALAGANAEAEPLATAVNNMRAKMHEWSEQVRQFTLHASHELKTPLTVMAIQFETMLRDKNLSPEQVEWMECQLDEIQRLGKIVDALSLLTKADAGLFTVEKRLVDFKELVQESYEDARFLAEANQLEVVATEFVEAPLLGDRHRLRQLLLNLVDNAIKYNRTGGKVTMALRRRNGTAELEITNTGEGLPPDMQTRVFERFVRGEEARSRALEGSGLGLSICKLIVEAHGGSIRLWSEPDRVTTVQVRLPLAKAEEVAQ